MRMGSEKGELRKQEMGMVFLLVLKLLGVKRGSVVLLHKNLTFKDVVV